MSKFLTPAAAVAALTLATLTLPACLRLEPEADSPALAQIDRGDRLLDSYKSNPVVLEEAMSAFHEAVRLDPDNPEGYIGLSRTQSSRKEHAAELAWAQKAVKRFPASAAAHFQLAWALGDNDKFADAVASFQRARQLDPEYPRLDAQLSWTYTQLGEHDKAVAAARRGAENETTYAWGLQQLGNALYAAGKSDQAVPAFKRAAELDRADPWAHKRLADAYITLDRYPEALAVLEKTVARFPSELTLLIDYGTCLQKNGRNDDALRTLAKAETLAQEKLALDRDNVEITNSLGVAQEYQGKLDAAFATYSHILELKPGLSHQTTAHRNLASTCIKLHKYEQAVEHNRLAWANSREPGDQRMIILSLFYAGKTADALAEADQWFAANSADSHGGRYMGIHTHSFAAILPDPAAAAKYLALAQVHKDPKWPTPCVDYLAGKITDEDLLKLATDNDKQTEARTYIGFKQIAAGNKDAGLENLRWVQKNGNPHYTETDQAIAYLLRTK